MEKLEHLKDLLGHKSKTHTYSGLLDELANLALDQLDPEKRSARRKENLRRKPIKIEAPKVADQSLPPVETASVPKAKRYVPRVTKDALWNRETGRCSFIDPKTKRRCPSRHALQIEHIVPFAKGGTSDLQNLTLLCQAHNQYSAIQSFGLGKMQKHWSRQSQELD
jgi:5-methylcytosine-specific restriction endonuclease McrA